MKKNIYDFLYHDARRVGSFLGQLDPHGYLKSLRHSAQTGGSNETTVKVEGGASFPGIAKVQGAAEDQIGEQWGRAVAGDYDPFWGNALALIDYLKDKKLLRYDLHYAGIGELVMLKGDLKILDLRLLQEGWNMPMIMSKLGLGDTSNMTQQQIDNNKLAMEIIKLLPHTVQAQIYCPEEGERKFSAAWMTLDPAGMVVPPGDILMKYGNRISGTWSMLAIKDALLDSGPVIDFDQINKTREIGWEKAADEKHTTIISLLTEILAPVARKVMGRPGIYYGVTPILVFREISNEVVSA